MSGNKAQTQNLPDIPSPQDIVEGKKVTQAWREWFYVLRLKVNSITGNLINLLGLTGTGLLVQTGTETYVNRILVAGANVTIINPDGVSGNITIAATVPNTSIVAGTYGTSTSVGSFTVASDGRLTAASNILISFPVVSIFGRTGTVLAASGDYTATQVGALPISGGALTGALSGTSASFSSTLGASNFSGSSSGTNTGDQNLAPYAQLSGATFTGPVIGQGTIGFGLKSITTGSALGMQIIDIGSNGANFNLQGNGSTTPNKTIRAQGGLLEFINSAYSAVIASLSDTGALSIEGKLSATSYNWSTSAPFNLTVGASPWTYTNTNAFAVQFCFTDNATSTTTLSLTPPGGSAFSIPSNSGQFILGPGWAFTATYLTAPSAFIIPIM